MFIHSNENVYCWCLWALNVLGDLFSNSWNRPTFLKQKTFLTSLLLFVG